LQLAGGNGTKGHILMFVGDSFAIIKSKTRRDDVQYELCSGNESGQWQCSPALFHNNMPTFTFLSQLRLVNHWRFHFGSTRE
jgi:hypothetical protein